MNELMNQVQNLIEALDTSDMVTSIKEVQDKISKDKELNSLLEEYSLYPREDIKTKVLESPLFQEYKLRETDLNLFIMEMNQRLKTISKKGSCHK